MQYKHQLASKKRRINEKNSPMAQTMPDALFGPIFVAATPPIAYFIYYNYICYKPQLVSKKEEEMKKKKNSLMAQTTHLVLFGPIFVAAAPPVACFIDYHQYVYTINISWLKKNEERKKLTYGTNNARCVVWPCFCCHHPSRCVFHRLQLYML